MSVKLAYCTTCMDRLEFLRGVWDSNIACIRGLPVEWVIVDYSSQRQDVSDWLLTRRARYPEQFAQVRAYRAPAHSYWHGSHAKNVAHALSGEAPIVCNLDCDTFVTPGHAQFLMGTVREGVFVGAPDKGTFGSIGMRKIDFFSLGGYDEDIRYYGYEDVDLMERAQRMSARRTIWPRRYWVAISHDLKTENSPVDRDAGMKASWNILTRNRRRPSPVANQDRAWGFSPGLIALW